jgi:hypothetical protein
MIFFDNLSFFIIKIIYISASIKTFEKGEKHREQALKELEECGMISSEPSCGESDSSFDQPTKKKAKKAKQGRTSGLLRLELSSDEECDSTAMPDTSCFKSSSQPITPHRKQSTSAPFRTPVATKSTPTVISGSSRTPSAYDAYRTPSAHPSTSASVPIEFQFLVINLIISC